MTPGTVREALDALRAARTRFGPEACRRKRALLETLAERPLATAADTRRYHDLLLFVLAHPDDAAVRRLAERELGRLGEIVTTRRGLAARLAGSGLAGTVVEAPFSIDLAEWLRDAFPGEVGIAWEEGSAGEALDEFLRLCVPAAERDGLLTGSITTREWMRLAAGEGGDGLGWLLHRLRQLPVPPEVLDHLFESLELQVRWRIPAGAAGRRFPPRRVYHQRDALRREGVSVRRPIRPPRELSRTEAGALIDTARTTLARLSRETDPITYANPAEVSLVTLERGLDVALFGMRPARRLPLESFFGYMAARNGVPVAYGGGWVFFERCEIGINIFEPFRGGESAHLFSQVLRVYHHHYDVRRFLVDPFQFGAGNPEGIRSGAFWFYYRLGFRPVDTRLAALAGQEWSRLRADAAYRTPARTLRRFATGRIALDLGRVDGSSLPDAVGIGLAVTRAVGERFGGDRVAAERWALRRVARALGEREGRGDPDERAAFARLALVAALIPDLADWPAADRRALAAAMRAKGGPHERDYARRLQRHERLRGALGGNQPLAISH